MRRNLHGWIADSLAAGTDSRLVGRDEQGGWTEGRFRSTVLTLSAGLAPRPESRWGLVSACPAQTAAGMLALLHAGKTVVLPPNRLPGTLADMHPAMDALLTDEPPDITRGFSTVVPLEPGNVEPPRAPPAPLDPETAVIEFHTSGSTAAPKRIRKVLRQLEEEITVLENQWGGHLADQTFFATVQHQHIYGLLFRVLWPLCAGRVFDQATYAYPEQLLLALRENEGGVLVSSPAQLSLMPELISLADLSDVCRTIFSSGGPLPPAVADTFHAQWGDSPVEVLGSTETGGIAWRQRTPANPEGLWTPFPVVDCGVPAPEGPLRIRSPYLPDPAETYETPDWVRPGPEGTFELLPRRDRIVKISEKRISLDRVEALLTRHPWVGSCAVAPLHRDSIGRRTVLGAVIVLTNEGRLALWTRGRKVLNEALRASLSGHLENVVLPRRWRYADALPVNPQGKQTHAELVRILGAPPPPPEMPRARLREHTPLRIRLELEIPEDLVYFRDHFPEMPVVPGVVLLDWVTAFSDAAFGCGVAVDSLKNVKFQQLLLPGDETELCVDWDGESHTLTYAYTGADARNAKGTLQMIPTTSSPSL